MAEVFLTLNGIGRGHLWRDIQVCGWLRRFHKRPVVFFQGSYPQDLALRYPGTDVPALYKVPAPMAQEMADEIARYANFSQPAIVIEDTHPAPVTWPASVKRILIVRPTVVEHMRLLQQKYSTAFSRFIVCDHPESPSWPYSEDETSEIVSWEKWRFVGPWFRRATERGIERVRERHALREGQQIFVFSLGGGGEKPGSGDRVAFLHNAEAAARELQEYFPQARLLFVCGPLFPVDLAVPSIFEVIREEPELPSLFAIAHGAVIRPGYNSLWECIAAGTPFLPIVGATYLEPAQQRVLQMKKFGLDIPQSVECWRDHSWRENYKQACRGVFTRFSGAPVEQFMSNVFPEPASAPVPSWPSQDKPKDGVEIFDELRASLRAMTGRKQVLIRIDDIVEICPAVDWLLGICRERSLFASLEVIPYLCRLNENDLNRLDPGYIFEVSQHGYAHLPHRAVGVPRKGEFLADVSSPSVMARTLLQRGIRLMRKLFRERFRGGYSAPYDGLPSWFASLWREIGGQYVSWIWSAPDARQIADVRIVLEPWDWRCHAERPIHSITSEIVQALQSYGFVGLVLHPQLLADPSHRSRIEHLIDTLVEAGCIGRRISDAARV